MAKFRVVTLIAAVLCGVLLVRSIDVTQNELIKALQNKNEIEAVRLIEGGIDANVTNGQKDTPMHYAAMHGYEKVIELLIDKGYANQINSVNLDRLTPVHNAASYRTSGKIMELLLQNGAEINKKNKDGYTPLYMAVINNNENMARLLIENGADLNIQDIFGDTALHRTHTGKVRMLKLLAEKGADLNMKNNDGRTTLHEATIYGNADVVELLINAGADVNIEDKYGKTPRHYATRYSYYRILNLLDAAEWH